MTPDPPEPPAGTERSTRGGARPRGRVIGFGGPDGAGKTSLCLRLVSVELSDQNVLHVRFPRLLPRRDPETRRNIRLAEASEDSARRVYPPRYPRPVAVAKSLYLFLDFWIGWIVRVSPHIRRGGWVLFERGWWDHAVDPHRYRLHSGRLIALMGRLIPRWDLVVMLNAPPDVIHDRKPELDLEEIDRQMRIWAGVLPARQSRIVLDATKPVDELARQVIDAVTSPSGSRADQWTGLSNFARPRWFLPASNGSIARAGLSVYHPVTIRGLVGWHAARLVAGSGLLKPLPRRRPPAAVLDALSGHLNNDQTVAVARCNHPNRYTATIIDPNGEVVAVGKIATDERAAVAIDTEAANLLALPRPLPPLRIPLVLHHKPGLLLLEAAAWRARIRPWRLPENVARSLGHLFRTGTTHGDCAPWNFLATPAGWYLIDWEEQRSDGAPYEDVFHYLVQSHALLRRPSARSLLRGLQGEGWVGKALDAYRDAAGLHQHDRRTLFIDYLARSADQMDSSARDGRIGLEARRRLLETLKPR